jgi:hypothetical protein
MKPIRPIRTYVDLSVPEVERSDNVDTYKYLIDLRLDLEPNLDTFLSFSSEYNYPYLAGPS